MTRALAPLLLLLVLGSPALLAQTPPPLREVAERFDKAQGQVRTLQCPFTLTLRRTLLINEARPAASEGAPRIPHAGRDVEQVPRMDRRAREVLPDRIDQQCVPARCSSRLRPRRGSQEGRDKGSRHENLHSVPHARQDDRNRGGRKPPFPRECTNR